MDEAVVINADGDALDDVPGGRLMLDPLGDDVAEGGGVGGQLLAPFLGRKGVDGLQP